MAKLICPKCGSNKLRRSRTRGPEEKFKKILGLRAFRCQTEGCDWRGLIKVKSIKRVFSDFAKDHGRFIIISIIFLILAYLSIKLILFLWQS